MKNRIKRVIVALLMVPALMFSAVVFSPSTILAKTCEDGTTVQDGIDCSQGTNTPTTMFGPDGVFTKIINTALFLVGAISVLMIIYGGIRYTISGGVANDVTAAKNTILYAVVGVVVSILAYAIVNFVLGALL